MKVNVFVAVTEVNIIVDTVPYIASSRYVIRQIPVLVTLVFGRTMMVPCVTFIHVMSFCKPIYYDGWQLKAAECGMPLYSRLASCDKLHICTVVK